MNPPQQTKSKPLSELWCCLTSGYLLYLFFPAWNRTFLWWNIAVTLLMWLVYERRTDLCFYLHISSPPCFTTITSACVYQSVYKMFWICADKSLLKFMIKHCFELFIYLAESSWALCTCLHLPFHLFIIISYFRTRDGWHCTAVKPHVEMRCRIM